MKATYKTKYCHYFFYHDDFPDLFDFSATFANERAALGGGHDKAQTKAVPPLALPALLPRLQALAHEAVCLAHGLWRPDHRDDPLRAAAIANMNPGPAGLADVIYGFARLAYNNTNFSTR